MRRRRSRRVFSARLASAVSKQLAEKVDPGEIGSDERFELLSADEHHPARSVDEYNRRARGESRLGSELGRYDQAPSIAHRYRISPTHNRNVPRREAMWEIKLSFAPRVKGVAS